MSLELVDFNPFANLRLPKPRGRRDITALTTEEVDRLADCAIAAHGEGYGDELRALILFAAYTGCRWGECCALTHDDIDWDKSVATISKTLSNDATEVMPPKNGKTRRVIIPEIAMTALRAMPRHLGRAASSPRLAVSGSARATGTTTGTPYACDSVGRSSPSTNSATTARRGSSTSLACHRCKQRSS